MITVPLFTYGVNPSFSLIAGTSLIPISALRNQHIRLICNNDRYTVDQERSVIPIVLYKAMCEFVMFTRHQGALGIQVTLGGATKASESVAQISALYDDHTAAMFAKLKPADVWAAHFGKIITGEFPHAYGA